jgi:hypothetical protein
MSERKHKQQKVKLLASHRIEHGPEPERLKIAGVASWEDAVVTAMKKKKPVGGWPK